MGCLSFTLPCHLYLNGYGVKLSTLLDTGAGGLAFLNVSLAENLSTFLGIPLETLPIPYGVRGYDGVSRTQAVQFIRLSLYIDKRRFLNVPIICLPLGNHNMIIGLQWFEHLGVLIDCAKRKLIWPKSILPHYSPNNLRLFTPQQILPAPKDQEAQNDADRRDEAFNSQMDTLDLDIKSIPAPRGILSIPYSATQTRTKPGRTTFLWDQRDAYRQMQRELVNFQEHTNPLVKRKKNGPVDPPLLNINAISGQAFHMCTKRRSNEALSRISWKLTLLLKTRKWNRHFKERRRNRPT